MSKKSTTCNIVAPAPSFWSFRSSVVEEVVSAILGESVLNEQGQHSHYSGGVMFDISNPSDLELVEAFQADRPIGGAFADFQRQDRKAPSLKFEAPIFAVDADGELDQTGARTQCQIEFTKGGHSGTLADTLVTVVFSASFDGGETWVKCDPERIAHRLSCGCETRTMGFVGTLGEMSERNGGNAFYVADELADYVRRMWTSADLVMASADKPIYTDRLGINGKSTGYKLSESRNDWEDREQGGGKRRL